MTYLNPPRLHFAGTFRADVSTVNNRPSNIEGDSAAGLPPADTEDTGVYRPIAWKPSTPQDPRAPGGWNPKGAHGFTFRNVTVRSAVGPGGGPVAGDPVLTLALTTPGSPSGKLVDLDSNQQMVSTIFGLDVALADPAGTVYLRATLTPVAFVDIWHKTTDAPAGDETAGVGYQSTLTNLRWQDVSGSPFLTQLRAAAGDGVLSVKFNLDHYTRDQRTGRVAGTIGVAAADDPVHTVIGRHFGGSEIAPPPRVNPTFDPAGGINFFAGVVDTAAGKIRLDLGNALPNVTDQTAPAPDVGELELTYDGAPAPFAPIDYRADGWYETTAGIVDLPADRTLTADELAEVAARPLLIRATRNGQPSVAIAEVPVHIRADEFVHRFDPETTWDVRFHVTERGEPKKGAAVTLQVLRPPAPADAVPALLAALPVPAPVSTDGQGIATVRMTAHDPGPRRFHSETFPRRVADGQVYSVRYLVDGAAAANPSERLSVLVWNAFPHGDRPSWKGEIGRVLRAYGNLYPSMVGVGPDLAVYDQVAAKAAAIAARLRLAETDAGYMPVSRDLSGQCKQAILTWLDNPGADGKPLFETDEEALPADVPDEIPSPAPQDPAILALGDKTAFAYRLDQELGPDE